MPATSPRVARAFLRYASPLAKLRSIPIFGGLIRATGRALVAPDTMVWVQIERGPSAGLWISLNPRTGTSILRGDGEPLVQEALASRLQPGMVFYDLGANIGLLTLLAARLVGPQGRVFAFEPDPVNFERLQLNAARNDFGHVVAERKAVWSSSSTVSFACANLNQSPDRGLGHISVQEQESGNSISVECVSLDDYCSTHPVPDFIKCDVEGAECDVFRGATSTLRLHHPSIICEMHSTGNRTELTTYFLDLGYSCYSLDSNHLLAIFK
jgi:FkbM family methyltransferase